MTPKAALIPALLALAALGAPAAAAPPPNDAPSAAAPFEVYSAPNGTPSELTATAELAEATPDRGVPSCLGRGSFARTVWYRIPATQTPRELSVDAAGRTLGVVDLAAFIQPGPGQTVTRTPNACAGAGVGGADSAGDATSGLTIRVGAYRDVLIQVGRRGRVGSPPDEEVQLWLDETELPVTDVPDGDRADADAPSIPSGGITTVALGNATLSQEDPFVARCPAAASVWRRIRAPSTGRWTFSADGADAGTLTIFTGARPTAASALGCIDREGPGPLVLPVPATRGRLLWVRIGTDRPVPGAIAQLRVRPSVGGDRPDGGACLPSVVSPSVSGRLLGAATVKDQNAGHTLVFALSVAHAPLCGASFTLTGPRGKTFARGVAGIVRAAQEVGVVRVRKLRPGGYRLRVDALGVGAIRNRVRSSISFRLR